jgi:uncharacterized protein YndB with AHSA1/START domain
MKKLNFSATINAPKDKVWKTLWDKNTYEQWTSTFSEGSTVETDNWKEGSKVLFLNKEGQGMVSEVTANRPGEYMAFLHKGEVKDGVEDTTSEKVRQWAGATETYSLKQVGDKTELLVEMDITDDFAEYFSNAWPKAMKNIQEIAER